MTENPCRETCARRRIARTLGLLLAALLSHQALAQTGPRPPCGMEPDPPYAELDKPPNVKFWGTSDRSRAWRPPVCTAWAETGYSTLIATSARFRYTSGADGLLRRIGAISALSGMRYWSTTHKQWRTLIESAHALTGAQPGARRQNFVLDELTDGSTHFYEQADNMSGTAIYQLRLAEVSADRLVLEVENVSAMNRFFVTLFHPGEVQSIYYLDRESDNVWRYYSLVRIGRNANSMAVGHPSSSINRAVAFYRWFVGIPTDREPPAAR